MGRRRPPTTAAAAAAAAAFLRAAGAQEACPIQIPSGGFNSNVAWTATWDVQPHHVMAPFAAELSPPVEITGLCDAHQFRPQDFIADGMVAGEWMARPKTQGGIGIRKDGVPCTQLFDGLSVTSAGAATLRLHFSGCGRPDSVMAVRIFNDTNARDDFLKPAGVGLFDFMCQLSPDECEAASQADSKAPARLPTKKVKEGKVGVGRCDGTGVIPEEIETAKSQSDCADTCNSRVKANLKDAGEQSCKGYAWSEMQKSCRVYSGWPITASSEDASEGYMCYKVRDAWAPTPAPPPEPTRQRPLASERSGHAHKAKLLLASLLADPKAVTARRMQVTPFQKGCFEPFDWYILDRSIFVEPDDYKALLQMTKASSTSLSSPVARAQAPRTDLIIERVCVRDCTSALRGECKELSTGSSSLLQHADAEDTEALRAKGAAVRCGSALCTLVGEEAVEAAFDPDFWPWALLLGLLAATIGFGGTSCLAVVWRRHKIKPRYQTVEAVKLVYEGEEEDEVVLQSTAGGSLMSVSGNGPALSSWQPSRGPRNSAMSSHSPQQASSPPHGRNVWQTR